MRAAGVAALARAPARAASTPPSRRRAIARRRARAAATSNDGRRASKRASDEKDADDDDDDDDDDGGGGPPVRAATATAVAAAVAAILASFSSGAPPWDRAMALSAADVGDDAGGGLAGALLARGNGLNGGGSEAWDRRVAEWAVDAFASLSREDQVIVVEKLEKLILSEDDAISRAGTSSSPRRTRPGDVDLTSREAEAEEADASPAAAERFVRPPARAPLDAPDVRVVVDDEDEAAALARADALDGWGPTTLGTSSSSSFDAAAAGAAAEKKERNPFVGRGLPDADADYLEPPSGEITTSSETTTIDDEDVEGAIAFATGAVDALRGAVERASRVASTPSDRARFGFLALIALAVGGTAARLVADAEDARESIEHERRRATTTTTTTDGGGGAADADAAAMGAPEGTTTTFGRGRELPDRARDAPAETSATAAAENPPNPNPPGGAPLWTRREDPERERDAAAEVATTTTAPASGAVLWTRMEGGGGGGARRGGGKDRRRGGRRRLDEDVDDAWEDYERGRGDDGRGRRVARRGAARGWGRGAGRGPGVGRSAAAAAAAEGAAVRRAVAARVDRRGRGGEHGERPTLARRRRRRRQRRRRESIAAAGTRIASVLLR